MIIFAIYNKPKMENQPTDNNLTEQTAKPARNYLLIVLAVMALVVAVYFLAKPKAESSSPAESEKKETLYNRDEPAEQQIYQDDYKQKIMELIDSGKTVGEISRETGVRRDVIRKIKKEMGKHDE